MIVRRVEPVSLARITGIIYAFMGLLMALPAGCALTLAGSMTNEIPFMFSGMGIFVILLYPIFFGVMGVIGGLISAVVYNMVAGRFGGIELEFEETRV